MLLLLTVSLSPSPGGKAVGAEQCCNLANGHYNLSSYPYRSQRYRKIIKISCYALVELNGLAHIPRKWKGRNTALDSPSPCGRGVWGEGCVSFFSPGAFIPFPA